jgi:ATP-dependent DNA helicase RecG
MVTKHQGRIVPTVGGMLLFGRHREVHFPDAWIQAGRFAGRDRTRIRDSVEIRSYPAQAIEAVIVFVEKHSFRDTEIGAVRRVKLRTCGSSMPCSAA